LTNPMEAHQLGLGSPEPTLRLLLAALAIARPRHPSLLALLVQF